MKQKSLCFIPFFAVFLVQAHAQVGIGTTTPLARLHVADSSVLFSAEGVASLTPAPVPIEGQGRRMMWYADKAAFRVGYVNGEQWDAANVGNYSFASGFSTEAPGMYATAMGATTIASGVHSTALGAGTKAEGDASTALGWSTEAKGSRSTAMGYYTLASGVDATAMGRITTASGEASTAMGNNTFATGVYATAMGRATIASGEASTAMGFNTKASGKASTAMGFNTKATEKHATAIGESTTASGPASTAMGFATTASGSHSTAMGYSVTAQAFASLAIGSHNIIGGDPYVAASTDPLFVVGNGTSHLSRSNALMLQRNGNLTIAGGLTQNSDARLKTNIHPLSMALSKVLKLTGYQYNWNTHYADKEELHTGLLAQEVQKLMPELVREDAAGTLSVSYTGLLPYLIEGMKEQQKTIEELSTSQKEMQELIKKLSTRIYELESGGRISAK